MIPGFADADESNRPLKRCTSSGGQPGMKYGVYVDGKCSRLWKSGLGPTPVMLVYFLC